MAKIIVQNTEIMVLSHDDKDNISLTDMANSKQTESRTTDIIKNWIRTRYTIEFLGTWDMIHNPIKSEEKVINSLEESIPCPHDSLEPLSLWPLMYLKMGSAMKTAICFHLIMD